MSCRWVVCVNKKRESTKKKKKKKKTKKKKKKKQKKEGEREINQKLEEVYLVGLQGSPVMRVLDGVLLIRPYRILSVDVYFSFKSISHLLAFDPKTFNPRYRQP